MPVPNPVGGANCFIQKAGVAVKFFPDSCERKIGRVTIHRRLVVSKHARNYPFVKS